MEIKIENLQLTKIPKFISHQSVEKVFHGEGMVIDLRGPVYFGWYSFNNYAQSHSYWVLFKLSDGSDCEGGTQPECNHTECLDGPFYWLPIRHFKSILATV